MSGPGAARTGRMRMRASDGVVLPVRAGSSARTSLPVSGGRVLMAGSRQPAAAGAAPPSRGRPPPGRRLAAWLSQERVFRLIPFIAVEAVFILVIIIPFILTIYISLLRWRANRPFEQANFSGFLNYGRVLARTSSGWPSGARSTSPGRR